MLNCLNLDNYSIIIKKQSKIYKSKTNIIILFKAKMIIFKSGFKVDIILKKKTYSSKI